MPNPYFSFKQFTIHQDRCAMKVCTDACLFGAWVAENFRSSLVIQPESTVMTEAIHPQNGLNILDIGCGTGLLSLMLAQKIMAAIDALEIEEEAFLQAQENVASGAWTDRINIIKADVTQYSFTKKYGLIISNPPFYENDLRSPNAATNKARHDDTLTLEALVSVASKQLLPGGSFAVLLPWHRTVYCIDLAASVGLFPASILAVKQSKGHDYFRSIVMFSMDPDVGTRQEALVIKEGNNYTPEFVSLLKEYYLNL